MAESEVIQGPDKEPVESEAAMAQLRFDDDAYAPLLAPQLIMARERAEYELGRSLITQTRELRLRDWPCWPECSDGVLLDHPPVQRIASIIYWDGQNWTLLSDTAYALERLDRIRHVVLPSVAWPALGVRRGHRIRISYVAGFGDDGTDVPECIRQWIVSIAGHAVDDPQGTESPPNEFINRRLDEWRTRI